ncbi:unnamed protein product, partial [Prorocentrum cordatum]
PPRGRPTPPVPCKFSYGRPPDCPLGTASRCAAGLRLWQAIAAGCGARQASCCHRPPPLGDCPLQPRTVGEQERGGEGGGEEEEEEEEEKEEEEARAACREAAGARPAPAPPPAEAQREVRGGGAARAEFGWARGAGDLFCQGWRRAEGSRGRGKASQKGGLPLRRREGGSAVDGRGALS